MPHTHGRTDKNQTDIVAALRDVGATVWITSDMGDGAPDIVVGFRGVNTLMEIKQPGERLTPEEYKWHESWHGQKEIVYVIGDALRAIGAI